MVAHAMERARGGHWLPQGMQARRADPRRARAGLRQQTERLTEAHLAGVVPVSECERRRREAEAWSHQAFQAPVVLLHDVVEELRLA